MANQQNPFRVGVDNILAQGINDQPSSTQAKAIQYIADRADGLEHKVDEKIALWREITRNGITIILLLGVVGTILGTFLYINKSEKNVQETSKDLITLMWTSQVTLLGSALGFYFGTKVDSKKEEDT